MKKRSEAEAGIRPGNRGKGSRSWSDSPPHAVRLRHGRHISPVPLAGVVPGPVTRSQELSDKPRSKKPQASRVRCDGSFERRIDTVTQRVSAATVSQPVIQSWTGEKPVTRHRPRRVISAKTRSGDRRPDKRGKACKGLRLGRGEKPRHPIAR
jgi:hypothetical protein